MHGRITSCEPAYNRHGIAYRVLYEREKRESEKLIARYREALEAWLSSCEEGPNSKSRRRKTAAAKKLTRRVLN